MLLENKVILITGAGRGMGRGIAQAVAEMGAHVIATDIDEKNVNETVAILEKEDRGQRAVALVMDITDADSIENALKSVLEKFSRLDGLVNNAAIALSNPAIESNPDERLTQFRVNVEGTFLCSQIVARQMMSQESGGAIVNIASEAGKVGHPNMAAYNSTKAAVISLTRTFSMEWAKYNINVNAVCPGGVDTQMLREVAKWRGERFDNDPNELLKHMCSSQLGRHAQPIEVGRVVAFLLSAHAYLIRGQAVNADGGGTPY